MGNNNSNLQTAKNIKDDEFYTTYEAIEKELQHYLKHFRGNQAWTGYQFGDMKFRVPQSSEPRSTRYWVDESGQKWRSLGNAMWLTNLDIERRHEQLVLTKKYDPKEYPHS